MLRVPARVRWHVIEVLTQWSLRSGVQFGAWLHSDAMLHSGGGGVGGWVGGKPLTRWPLNSSPVEAE